MMQNISQILIIKLGALGDFVLSTGVMRGIREKYPKAHITLMTNSHLISLAKQSGYFDAYIVDDRTHKLCDYCRLGKELSSSKFDLILDMQLANRTKRLYYFIVRFFSKKSFVWGRLACKGFTLEKITKRFPFSWGTKKQDFLTIKSFPPSLKFCHGENKNFSILPKKYVLLIPGCSANHPYKRWPAKSYAELALKLAERKIYTVVLGTEIEQPEILEICNQNSYAINFCNKSSLMDIPDLAKKAIAIVGNDTGPTHMASLVDRPVIALFCKITENSALTLKNVHNIIRPDIADISVKEVLDLLK